MAKRRSKKKSAVPSAKKDVLSVTPEDFAPYPESELRAVAAQLVGATRDRVESILSETPWGAELLAKAARADHVARPLVAVWGPPGLARAA